MLEEFHMVFWKTKFKVILLNTEKLKVSKLQEAERQHEAKDMLSLNSKFQKSPL